jgi:hypothetical protein
MSQLIRTLIVLFALVGAIEWTIFTAQVWQFGNSFKGMGDGAGANNGGGSALLSVLLIVAFWLLPVSPHLCMAGGALNLITGKSQRVAYVYALVVLALLTLIELLTFQRRMEFMALGNFVAGGLWAWSFRGSGGAESDPNTTKAVGQ